MIACLKTFWLNVEGSVCLTNRGGSFRHFSTVSFIEQFILLLLLLLSSSLSSAIDLKDHTSQINAYAETSYYLEPLNTTHASAKSSSGMSSSGLSPKQVMQQQFSPAPETQDSNLSFGYTDASLWIKFDLTNQSAIEDWLIEVGYPILDQVDLYVFDNGKLQDSFKTGDRLPNSERPINHRNFIFPISLAQNQSKTLLLKVTTTSSLRVPLTIWQQKTFFETDQYRLLIQGSYFGILVIMMLYNLFIFFSIKEKAYLHYVFYVASYIVVQASINGFWGQLFIPEPNALTDKSIVLSLSLVILFGCSFSLSFLNLKFNHTNSYKLLKSIGWLGGINFIVALFVPYTLAIKSALFLAVFGSLTITVIGLYLWNYMSVREARFFSIAWVGFLIGSVLMMLSRMQLLPDNFITENAAQLGSAFEVTLLSFALADKFSQMRGESEKVETKAKESLSQVNNLLTETLYKLEKSNAIKSDFLATISHELRTPMNGIVASNELLKAAKLDAELKEYVEISETSAAQMMTLINSILQFVDLQSGESKIVKAPVDIQLLFNELEKYAAEKIKGRKIVLNFSPTVEQSAELYSDYQKIFAVLRDLIDNALKFTASGQINVTAAFLGEGALDDIEFSVEDSGIGIAADNLEKIFDAFYLADATSKRRYGGIGMGLTTAQSLAGILGGKIHASSKLGEGSRFVFKLPLYDLHR